MSARFQKLLSSNIHQAAELDAPLTNDSSSRSPEALRAVLAQFNVESSPRYQPKRGADGKLTTFCNIFMWDATRALMAEIPHWVGEEGDRRELNCNNTLGWLELHGPAAGWRETKDPLVAAAHASNGGPAIVIWRNPSGGPGHVAMLLPSSGTEVRIAQAGARCLFDVPLDEFGVVHGRRYFTHP